MSSGLRAVPRLLRAVQRRERLAESAALLTRAALPLGCLLAAIGLAAARRLGAPPWLPWLGLVPVPAALAYAWLRPRALRLSARRVDAHYGLHDLLGGAWELTRRPPAEPRAADMVALLAADAEAAAAGLDPRPVVPLRPPGLRLVDLAAAGLLLAAMLIPPPAPPERDADAPADATGAAEAASPRRPAPDRALAEPVREDLKQLKEGHDRAAELAHRMLEVLDAYGRGELDREAAYAQLEQLEKELAEAEDALEASLEEDPAILAEGVRRLSEALKEEEVTRPAGEAFARGDGDEAERALAEAEAEAEAGEDAERQLQRALDKAERALGKAAGENSDIAAQLAEAERRLKRQQQQPAADPEEQERRLKKQQERVDELRRQHEREKAAQRKLDQLRREASDAQKGGKGSQQRKRALEQLRREGGDAARKASQSRRLGQARDDLEEAKSFLRRAGQGGEQDEKRKQQMQKFSRAAKGKRGEKGKGPTLLVEGDLGDGDPDETMMMDSGDGQDGQGGQDSAGEQDSGEGQDGQGQDSGGAQDAGGQALGDGMGQGSADPLADPTGLKVKPKDVRVDPKQGRGATRAEVMRTASQEGFASESYRDVYSEYRSFAQSSMDSEALPPAQRRRVKRYFQLIQPRR